jgi:molybdopterin-guanine dinucleotide biosynthesis protein A
MIERMRAVRFVSTLVVQELDPELKTFFNVNTLLDLKRAGGLVKRINGRGRLGTSARS